MHIDIKKPISFKGDRFFSFSAKHFINNTLLNDKAD